MEMKLKENFNITQKYITFIYMGKNGFIEVSKILARYKSKNNFVSIIKIINYLRCSN